MTWSHDILDIVEAVGVAGVAVVWIYDRLKSTEVTGEEQTKLTKRLDTMDLRLTGAMTQMAHEVGSLARSVSKLEGSFETYREISGRK